MNGIDIYDFARHWRHTAHGTLSFAKKVANSFRKGVYRFWDLGGLALTEEKVS